jgi:uncharacterized protein (DUF1778 family)
MGQAVKTKTLNVRTTEEAYKTVQDIARFQGMSVSAFIMDAIWKQIEDWEDIQAIEEYERQKAAGKEIKYYSLDEIIEKHGLDL